MAYGLTEKEITLINEVFKKNPQIERVFIHGSRAKDNFKKTSDIDFGVQFSNYDQNLILRLRSELNDLPVIYEIDAMDEKEIFDKGFKDEYQKIKKLFYQKIR